MSRHDEETINRWVGSAPYWEKHREIIREMFDPISQALIEDANVTKRNVVLDVATGPGEPALSIAEVVGAEGKVFGIDPIQDMVATARRAADRLGYKNAQFDVAFADRLPFSRDTFDAVVSRFGVITRYRKSLTDTSSRHRCRRMLLIRSALLLPANCVTSLPKLEQLHHPNGSSDSQ